MLTHFGGFGIETHTNRLIHQRWPLRTHLLLWQRRLAPIPLHRNARMYLLRRYKVAILIALLVRSVEVLLPAACGCLMPIWGLV